MQQLSVTSEHLLLENIKLKITQRFNTLHSWQYFMILLSAANFLQHYLFTKSVKLRIGGNQKPI